MPRVRCGRYGATTTGRTYPNAGAVRGGRFGVTNIGRKFPPRKSVAFTREPWLVNVHVFMTPSAHTNWNTNALEANIIYNAARDSSGAQNDLIDFKVLLDAGTWTFELIHVKSTNRGIYDVQLDASSIGTIDGYNGATAYNQRTQITGVVVAVGGIKTLRFKMSTKNASSSSYVGSIMHAQFKRTA